MLIANTSNMPMAARGVHLHGHHAGGILPRHGLRRGHDGGFHVPLGRSAARDLRPSGGDAPPKRASRLPASRLAAFYERAGCVQSLSGAAGSVSIIGAVSPQGS